MSKWNFTSHSRGNVLQYDWETTREIAAQRGKFSTCQLLQPRCLSQRGIPSCRYRAGAVSSPASLAFWRLYMWLVSTRAHQHSCGYSGAAWCFPKECLVGQVIRWCKSALFQWSCSSLLQAKIWFSTFILLLMSVAKKTFLLTYASGCSVA